MPVTIRTGAIGALLDEYERALTEFKMVIRPIPDASLIPVIDPQTEDANNRSLQTILTHVVYAGYGYATLIHNTKGHNKTRPVKAIHDSIGAYLQDLDHMFAFTEQVFAEIGEEGLLQYDEAHQIRSGWGQTYDIEQLAEHAIVHILRHRRQIERFKAQKLI